MCSICARRWSAADIRTLWGFSFEHAHASVSVSVLDGLNIEGAVLLFKFPVSANVQGFLAKA